jgi:hypothetical protein
MLNKMAFLIYRPFQNVPNIFGIHSTSLSGCSKLLEVGDIINNRSGPEWVQYYWLQWSHAQLNTNACSNNLDLTGFSGIEFDRERR